MTLSDHVDAVQFFPVLTEGEQSKPRQIEQRKVGDREWWLADQQGIEENMLNKILSTPGKN